MDTTSGRDRVAIPVIVLVLTAVVTLVCLRAYFRTDYQFGLPGNAYDRLWDRIAAEGASGDEIVTVAPLHYHVPMNRYKGPLPILGFAQMETPLAPQAVTLLKRALAGSGRVWLVTAGLRPAESNNGVERWLSEQEFKASDEWYDDSRLCVFATSGPAEAATPSTAVFGDAIRLRSYAVGPARLRAGDCLSLTLNWQAQAAIQSDYTVFVHLVGPDGRPVAQQDGAPVGGFVPTSIWAAGAEVVDRHGLLVPRDLAPGRYEIWIGLYGGERQERLPVRRPAGQAADHLVLASVEVELP